MDALPGAVSVHRYWRHTLALEPDADAVAETRALRHPARRRARRAARG